jgi:hypothetical protein
VVRRAFAVALAAASLAACAQLLGIEAVHDDPADASAPVDGAVAQDAAADHAADAGVDGPADATIDVPPSVDAPVDTAPADTGPTVDPALGCTTPDGGPVGFFTNVSTFPLALAIDHAGIYVEDINGVRRCSLEGCDSGTTVVYPSQPQAFGADDEHLVVCDNGVLTITDPNGNTVRSWVALTGCSPVAAHGLDVYWANYGEIHHAEDAPDAGQSPAVNPTPGAITEMAPTSRWLFFLAQPDPEAGAQSAVRCDLPSCDGGAVVLGSASPGTGNLAPTIAANESHVFWADPSSRALLTCSADGCDGGPSVMVADAAVSGVFADEGALYWATSEGAFGNVYKTPLDGGPTVTLAVNQRVPARLTANAACVYWTDNGFKPTNSPGLVLGVRQP